MTTRNAEKLDSPQYRTIMSQPLTADLNQTEAPSLRAKTVPFMTVNSDQKVDKVDSDSEDDTNTIMITSVLIHTLTQHKGGNSSDSEDER